MKLTIIVPAFNEEAYLAPTLDSIRAATDYLGTRSDADVEVIVVDNDSQDETAAVARRHGATVVHESVRNIARARNTGARHAAGDLLVFVDADVAVPPTLLHVIQETTRGPCGESWSGRIPSSSRCSAAGRRPGRAGTRTRCGRAQGHRRGAENRARGRISVVISPQEDYPEQSGTWAGADRITPPAARRGR